MRPHILWIKVGFIGAGIHALVVEEGLLGDLIAKKTMLTPNDSEISSLDFPGYANGTLGRRHACFLMLSVPLGKINHHILTSGKIKFVADTDSENPNSQARPSTTHWLLPAPSLLWKTINKQMLLEKGSENLHSISYHLPCSGCLLP